MRLLPALVLLALAAPVAAQTPAPPTAPEGRETRSLEDLQRDQRDVLETLRERLQELRLRGDSLQIDSLRTVSRCDAGPIRTPFSPGGAGPIRQIEPGSPVPMPNLCDGGGVVAVVPREVARPQMRATPAPLRIVPPVAPPRTIILPGDLLRDAPAPPADDQ